MSTASSDSENADRVDPGRLYAVISGSRGHIRKCAEAGYRSGILSLKPVVDGQVRHRPPRKQTSPRNRSLNRWQYLGTCVSCYGMFDCKSDLLVRES